MEPTLTELLNTEFLHCPGCMRGCYKPRMLTCLHSFCDNCVRSAIVKVENSPHAKAVCNGVENHVNENEHSGKRDSVSASKVQENRSDGNYNEQKQDTGPNSQPAQQVDNTVKKCIVCPLCKESTKLPANGGIHGLPLNIFLNSLLQIKGYKMEEGQTCDYCKYDGKETPAGELCLECQDVLCTECSAAHRRTKLTREHQVVPFTEIAKHRYDHDIRAAQREKCSIHNGQEATWFCEECKVTMCSECKGRQHYQHSYWSFEAALRQYQSKTKMLLGTIDSKLPSIDAWLKFMQAYTEDVKILQEGRVKEIEKHTRDLHRMIEDLKNKHIQRITEVCQQQRKTTLSKMKGLMRAGQYLKHDSQLLTNLLKFGKADEILSMQAPIAERASQLSNQQLGSISSKLTIHFQPKSMGTDCLDKLFGNLSISYLPLTQQESISLGGNSISASIMLPSVLKSAEHVRSFDADCGTDTKDVWPSGVCITQEGDYAIVDRDNSRVKIFDKNGGVKANFGGVGQHELGSPFDVALLKDGNLAVTDYESEDIKIFKPTGEFVRSLRGSFKYPRGIAVNSKGHIVVVDCHFRRVTMHCPETGKLLQTIQGKDENGCDFFTDPYYVAVTPDDKVVVTDWAAPNIRVFSREGRQLNSYGSYGTRQDQILHPYGVCSDQYGYIFVADNQNHRIHLLLPDGNFSRHILTKVDSLWHPIGLVTDNSGNLILTEALGKVKIYKYV